MSAFALLKFRQAHIQLHEKARQENPQFPRDAVKSVREKVPAHIRATSTIPSKPAMARTYRRYLQAERAEQGDDLMDVDNVDDIQFPNQLNVGFVLCDSL